MEKIRWGIIGPGIIAHEFAHDFKFVGNAELKAVASRSFTRATEFAEKYDIPKSYGSYQELYEDADIDAIYVATPHTFHLQNSRDALQGGKAVLCEKPITTSPLELRELLEAADKTGNYLLEGMWTYFLPVIKKAKSWVEEGRIGKVRHIKSDFGYPVPFDPNGRMFNPELAGGSLLDMGIYTIAMAWYFKSMDPESVHVFSRKARTGVDLESTIVFDYGDAIANLSSSFRCKLNNWTYIIGEDGYIAIPDFWRAKECHLYKVEECVDRYTDERTGFGFNYEVEAASSDILEGKTQSDIMPHHYSKKLQEYMAEVAAKF